MELSNCFNRTLWNWNQIKDWGGINAEFVLIVPYGIEIGVYWGSIDSEKVLIVPYGIEI